MSPKSHPRKLPSLEIAKEQAKRLRHRLRVEEGQVVGHSQALEILSKIYGYRDWNTLHAAIGNRPPTCPVSPGDRVKGRYLSQEFSGEVRGVTHQGAERYELILHFDEPVDVVTFDSFSAFRQRVHCTIQANGKTPRKTSDGRPHLELYFDPEAIQLEE